MQLVIKNDMKKATEQREARDILSVGKGLESRK